MSSMMQACQLEHRVIRLQTMQNNSGAVKQKGIYLWDKRDLRALKEKLNIWAWNMGEPGSGSG